MRLSEIEDRLAELISTRPSDENVTWRWIKEMAAELGCQATRQWLHRNQIVLAAYQARKAHVVESEREKTGEAAIIDRLRDQLHQRDETIRGYEKRFFRYIHNATERGVTIEQLEAPIPGLERVSSEPVNVLRRP